MSEKVYNKLVRDGIPGIIREHGEDPQTRILNDEEFRRELLQKLIEEARELLESGTLEERADVAEVLKAIDELMDWTPAQIETARAQKAAERGGFNDRIFLEKTIDS